MEAGSCHYVSTRFHIPEAATPAQLFRVREKTCAVPLFKRKTYADGANRFWGAFAAPNAARYPTRCVSVRALSPSYASNGFDDVGISMGSGILSVHGAWTDRIFGQGHGPVCGMFLPPSSVVWLAVPLTVPHPPARNTSSRCRSSRAISVCIRIAVPVGERRRRHDCGRSAIRKLCRADCWVLDLGGGCAKLRFG